MLSKSVWYLIGLFALISLVAVYFLFRSPDKRLVDNSKVIKVGALLALTGEAASYGASSKNVINLAVEEINKAGGISGIPLQIVFENGKCSAKDGVIATKKLIFIDKVKLIIGASCSNENLASIPIITENHVVLFSPTATSPELTNSSPYFFRNHPSDDDQGNVMADFVYNVKKWRKIAVLVEQSDYPLGVFEAFKTTFEQLGGKVFKQEFATTETDYRLMIAKLQSENPDALFLAVNTPLSVERTLKQLKSLKWNPPLIALDSFTSNSEAVLKLKSELEGALSAEFNVDPKNPKFQHLSKAYKDKYGTDLPYPTYMQNVYDAVYLIKDGIIQVGYDGDRLAAWSRTIHQWEGASGKVTINQKGDRVGSHEIKIIKNGRTYDYAEDN